MRKPECRPDRAIWLILVALGASCAETGEPATEQRGAAAAGAPSPREGTLQAPRLLNPDGPYLVTPRPSPDGRWVAAAGRGGVGVYLLRADGGAAPRALDRAYLGPRAWSADPLALHFGHGTPRAWDVSVGRLVAGRPLWKRPWDDELGRFLGRGSAGSVYHHPRLGSVTLLRPDGSVEVRGEERAWGARLSPDGRRVAWCTGVLAAPQLHLWTFETGETVILGAGAQPAWSPDGRQLLFARPLALRRFGGRATVVRAELWRWRADGPATLERLPTRPGHAPMEPAWGPDGETLYYADWQDGRIYRAALPGAGGAR